MKRTSTIFATFLLLLCASTFASAQSLFIEDFNYTTSDTLTKHGWLVSSGGTTNALLATSPGLTFTNYASSGIGNCTKLDTTGQDLYKSYTADSIGSVYLAFMFNVTKAATGDYFIGLSPSSSQTNYYARTFIKSSGVGFVVGISKSNESATYGTTVFSLNTTYVAVVKYTFVAADSDFISVMILPSSAGLTAEPSTAEISAYQDKTKNDATNLKFVTLRQGSAAGAPRLFIDGVRIGTTWNDVFFSTLVSKASIDFNKVNVGSTAKDSLYVKNTGVSSVSIASAVSSDPVFTISPTSATIAVADSQKFVVTYLPISTVASTAKVSITPSGATSSDTVAVTGTGIQAGFSMSPTSLNFKNVFKDSTKIDSATVSNASTSAHLIIDSVKSTNPLFTVTPTSGNLDTSSTMKFAIAFVPTAKGPASGKIVFYHNAPSKQDTLTVSGNGILIEPLIKVTPTSVNFSVVLVGQSKKDSVVVQNIGYDSLFITGITSSDAEYTFTPATVRLDTMATKKFYITFTPTAVGRKTAVIVATSNVSEVHDTLNVTGLGSTVVTIAEARKDANNDFIPDHSVTKDTLVISGVVTTQNMGATAGQTSYFIQDGTGGMDVFAFGLASKTYLRGDSVLVIGTVAQFNGLDEFKPLVWDDANVKVLSHVAVPAPRHLTLHQFVTNAESYEGQLIRIDTLYKATGTWPGAGVGNVSIFVTNATKADTAQMFLDLDAAIGGSKEPAYPISVVGIVSQYTTSVPPNNGYEISPRDSLDIIHTPGTTGVQNQFSGIPNTYELHNNYPNPFNPSTTILYGLPQQSHVTVTIYSVLGQELAILVNDVQGPSYYRVVWNGQDKNGSQVSSGVYFFRMVAQSTDGKTQSFVQVKKMMMMK